VNSSERDSLVTELSNELEGTAESFDVSSQGGDLTVFKVRAGLQPRDVGLINLGLLRDIDLSLADGVPQGSQGEVNASGGAKPATEYSDGLSLRFWTTFSRLGHVWSPDS
jgi:hypothetical protein